MEEYELMGSESDIRNIFAVFSRTEELLNTTPLSQYGALLSMLETNLGTHAVVHSDVSDSVQLYSTPPVTDIGASHSMAFAGGTQICWLPLGAH